MGRVVDVETQGINHQLPVQTMIFTQNWQVPQNYCACHIEQLNLSESIHQQSSVERDIPGLTDVFEGEFETATDVRDTPSFGLEDFHL